MPSFTLGEKKYKALDGEIYTESVTIITRSRSGKAILLSIQKPKKSIEIWIPLSLCTITENKINIRDWFWDKEVSK